MHVMFEFMVVMETCRSSTKAVATLGCQEQLASFAYILNMHSFRAIYDSCLTCSQDAIAEACAAY